MKIKTFIQFLLLLLVAALFILTFYFYFYKNEISGSPEEIEQSLSGEENKNNIIEENIDTNILKKVSYENFDNKGNSYKIIADKGEIKNFGSDIIYMTNVKATVYLENGNFLTIVSNNANFNNRTFETNFINNIKLNYLDHQINSESLDLLFNENLITIKKQVKYKNLNTEMFADAIVIDLVTKNSKIFMNNDEKKVKIFGKN
jgi:lipopolysaccharide export system protein LptC|tara:strand:+ start:1243 stop:1851 length:609 start_codon:yes stop_codon:yes gene_type:complete